MMQNANKLERKEYGTLEHKKERRNHWIFRM